MDKARASSMPKENVERAIKRGTGEDKEGAAFETMMYEGYGPHGSALLIQVVTDNRNRSVADLRRVMTRSNGTMAEAGAVSWQFTRKAYITVPAEGNDTDTIFELAVEAGADDVLPGDDEIEIYAPAENYHTVVQALDQAGVKIERIRVAHGAEPESWSFRRDASGPGDAADRAAGRAGRRAGGLFQPGIQ